MQIRYIIHGSEEYTQMLALRLGVLLHPIGIGMEFIRQDAEASDVLIGAYEASVLVGCCILSELDRQKVQLRQMAVKETHQGKGVGGLLLQWSEVEAGHKGYTVLQLHARDVVMSFYAKNGYAAIGPGFEEVGIPHHVMTKVLKTV